VNDNLNGAGVVYVAVGRECIDEALRSASSLKRHMPDLPVTLFASEPLSSPAVDEVVLIREDRYRRGAKVGYMARSPYPRTLFLDTDTYVCGELFRLFSLLDYFDIAAAHGPRRTPDYYSQFREEYDLVPHDFCQLNSGVILFKKSPQLEKCLARWNDLNIQNPRLEVVGDQLGFRRAVFESGLKLVVLPSEYNCMANHMGYAHGHVYILHSWSPHLEAIAGIINSYKGMRIFKANLGGNWFTLFRDDRKVKRLIFWRRFPRFLMRTLGLRLLLLMGRKVDARGWRRQTRRKR